MRQVLRVRVTDGRDDHHPILYARGGGWADSLLSRLGHSQVTWGLSSRSECLGVRPYSEHRRLCDYPIQGTSSFCFSFLISEMEEFLGSTHSRYLFRGVG